MSDIADPVATRVISGIKYSMISLFASHQVDMDSNFAYGDIIYTTVSMNVNTVIYNLDNSDGIPIIYLPIRFYYSN